MKATIQTGLYAGNCARMARQRHELITHRSDRDERENPGWWPRNDYGYPVRGHQPALVELAPLASHASVHCHDGPEIYCEGIATDFGFIMSHDAYRDKYQHNHDGHRDGS